MTSRASRLLVLVTLLVTSLLLSIGAPGSSSAAPSASPLTYLPVLFSPSYDLDIAKLVINQSIQTATNDVVLVANKDTVVRVFARVTGATSASSITVSLSASRNSTSLGTVTSSPATVPAVPDRGVYTSTFNFILPNSWLSGSVNLTAKVDSANAISESNESNNSLQQLLNFSSVPNLNVKIVPINYHHQGPTNPRYYPGQAVDHISNWITRAYPVASVNVSYRSPYTFYGDLESSVDDWIRLLNEVSALKFPDGAPGSQAYYALVPTSGGGYRWFYGGIAGIGWVGGFRASVGLELGANDNTGILAGHEIGHNMGRSHAPCGVSSPDPAYPYANADIGQFGLDIIGSSVDLLAPAAYKDLMSYCGPEWISDYTYEGLYADQMANGLLAPVRIEDSLMVRVSFDQQGAAALLPVYAFAGEVQPASGKGDQVLQLLDGNGKVIASQQVDLLWAEEPGVSGQAIITAVPMPQQPVASIRLLQNGQVRAQRDMAGVTAAAPGTASIERQAGTGVLSWNSAERPALVRFTADEGQSWTTMGVDVADGRLAVDLSALPAKSGSFQIILADSPAAAPLSVTLD